MAAEYTITYTFTGQDNTSGNRSVALSRFAASGDTDKTIAQITSIQYVHYHTSAGSMRWGLRGRLVLSDGSIFTSDQVYNNIDGDVVRYVNTFTDLPTAEQLIALSPTQNLLTPEEFAAQATIQTLDTQGKTTSGGYSSKLYWRATSKYPMQIIISFIDEPPVTYAPKVDRFEVTRCNADGMQDREGEFIAATLKLSVGDAAGLALEGVQCRIYYAANAYPQIGVSQYVDLTSRIPELIGGVELNTDILSGAWNLAHIWNFALVFIVDKETAIATTSAARGTTSLHISGEPGGGAAIGGFSTGTTENPKFESYVPAHLYGGIEGVTNYSTEEVKTGGSWIDGKPIYRITIPFSITATNTKVDIAPIPGLSQLIRLYGAGDRGQGTFMPQTFFYDTSNYNTFWVEQATLKAKTSMPLSGYMTVEYTKQSD